jgi:uncharacterized protein involved in exopolysaccharide biosynthesis
MGDEINLRDYLKVLKKRWKTIAAFAFVLGLLALIFSLLSKPVYEVETTLLIRGDRGNSYSGLAGLVGLAGFDFSGGGSMNELTELLNSRIVATKVLKDLNLKERVKGWDDPLFTDQKLAKSIQKLLNVLDPSGNMLTLKVQFTDPVLATEITNAFLDSLSYYWNKLNYTEARKKREYIEKQLPGIEKDLKEAEQKLKKFTLLGSGSSSGLMAMASSQSSGIEVKRLVRELEIQNTVYTMLRKEYETVKLEESKEIPPFSIVDKPEVPEKPVGPRKKLNTLVGIILGLFMGTFVAFFKEYWEKSA